MQKLQLFKTCCNARKQFKRDAQPTNPLGYRTKSDKKISKTEWESYPYILYLMVVVRGM
jgi:hypothetical protein